MQTLAKDAAASVSSTGLRRSAQYTSHPTGARCSWAPQAPVSRRGTCRKPRWQRSAEPHRIRRSESNVRRSRPRRPPPHPPWRVVLSRCNCSRSLRTSSWRLYGDTRRTAKSGANKAPRAPRGRGSRTSCPRHCPQRSVAHRLEISVLSTAACAPATVVCTADAWAGPAALRGNPLHTHTTAARVRMSTR